MRQVGRQKYRERMGRGGEGEIEKEGEREEGRDRKIERGLSVMDGDPGNLWKRRSMTYSGRRPTSLTPHASARGLEKGEGACLFHHPRVLGDKPFVKVCHWL